MNTTDIQSVKQRFGIIGNSSPLNHAINVAIQVAATDMTVLITGESGSGKEMFSKIIHHLSTRKHGPFIAINCGAIPEGTIDSELFGHEKGSFTGAHEARKGYFEVTDGGTIFLDEIGEMPHATQARLLRVLENGEFIKVGSSKVQKTNVRVVAATNVDLFKAVSKGSFREDLYYRLNTVPIYVPPLRERGNDIALLFRKFAADFEEKYHIKPVRLTDDARELLIKYRFPGNIRQLRNIVEQMSVLEMEREISLETLKKYLPADQHNKPVLYKGADANGDTTSEREILYKILFDMKKDLNEVKRLVFDSLQKESYGDELISEHRDLFEGMDHNFKNPDRLLEESRQEMQEEQEQQKPKMIVIDEEREERVKDIEHEEEEESLSLEEKEKELIIKALEKNRNKRKQAAKALGISERTLYRKIKQYQLDKE